MSDYPMLISNKLHSFRNFVGADLLLPAGISPGIGRFDLPGRDRRRNDGSHRRCDRRGVRSFVHPCRNHHGRTGRYLCAGSKIRAWGDDDSAAKIPRFVRYNRRPSGCSDSPHNSSRTQGAGDPGDRRSQKVSGPTLRRLLSTP